MNDNKTNFKLRLAFGNLPLIILGSLGMLLLAASIAELVSGSEDSFTSSIVVAVLAIMFFVWTIMLWRAGVGTMFKKKRRPVDQDRS